MWNCVCLLSAVNIPLHFGYIHFNFIKIPGGNDADPGLALVQNNLVVLQIIVVGDAELPVLLPADGNGLSAGDKIAALRRVDVDVQIFRGGVMTCLAACLLYTSDAADE